MKNPIKGITHVFALVGGAIAAFLLSPAGQALVHQYPILAPFVPFAGAAGVAAAVYHSPRA